MFSEGWIGNKGAVSVGEGLKYNSTIHDLNLRSIVFSSCSFDNCVLDAHNNQVTKSEKKGFQ